MSEPSTPLIDFYTDRKMEVMRRENVTQKGLQKFFIMSKETNSESHTIPNAVDYSQSNFNLPIFALDKEGGATTNKGAKYFFVGSYMDFFNHYSLCKKERRCFYETILPDMPCDLYLDLEYNKEKNPQVVEEYVEGNFKKECFELIEEEYGILPTEIDLVIMQSSNAKKFSKHYIYKIQKRKFKNNYHCGAFVRKLRNRILKKYGSKMSENPFFVNHEKEQKNKKFNRVFFADLGVYTLRRQWRVYGSTKEGEYRPLVYEGEETRDAELIDKKKLFNSLVQRIPEEEVNEIQLLSCYEEDGSDPISTSNKYTFLPEESEQKDENLIQRFDFSISQPIRKNVLDENSSYIPSDILDPILNQQIMNAIADSWPRNVGNLTFFYYSRKYGTIKYNTSSKDCLIANRVHKGNHVWFRVYLKEFAVIQGCLDSECNGKSESRKNGTGEITTKKYPLNENYHQVIKDLIQENQNEEFSTLAKSFISASNYMTMIDKSKFF